MLKSSAFARRQSKWVARVGLFTVLLCWLGCLGLALGEQRGGLFGIDFASVYAGSACLVNGCNPYDAGDTEDLFDRKGGILTVVPGAPTTGPFSQYYAGYPPTTLFYLLPITLLRWPAALWVWLAILFVLYGLAIALISGLCSRDAPVLANLCLGIFVLTGPVSLILGQPGLVAIALCCGATWCFLTGRAVRWGVFAMALSLAWKPHIGALILLYFLLAGVRYRRIAWSTVALAIALCVPPLLWVSSQPASRDWLTDYRANLSGVAQRGNLSDPGPSNAHPEAIADLQTIVSVLRNDASFYNPVSWGICLALCLCWGYPVLTVPPSYEKDVLAVAAIASLSMLPVYHRQYDARLLILTFPALASLMRRSRHWAAGSTLTGLLLTTLTSEYYAGAFLPRHTTVFRLWLSPLVGRDKYTMLFERPAAMGCLLSTSFFLFAMYRVLPRTQSSALRHGIETAHASKRGAGR